jgi:putative ABC transport system permease protein
MWEWWTKVHALLFRRKDLADDLREEIESHLDMEIRDRLERGQALAEAEKAARREFGNVNLIGEKARDAWSFGPWEIIWRDSLYAARLLIRNPGFATVAVATLALGIGASTAVYSVVRGVLIESVPFRDPSRLVAVLDHQPGKGADWLYVSRERFDELSRSNKVFEEMAALRRGYVTLAEGGAPHMVAAHSVSAGFFPMLGIKPVLGRLFMADEERPGGEGVALLSYGLWRTQFAADPAILGKRIGVTAQSPGYTVIGVLPQGFQFASADVAVWTPLINDPASPYRSLHLMLVLARLKDAVTIGQAQAAAEGVAAQLARNYPSSNAGWDFTVRDFQEFYRGRDNVRNTLLMLLAAVIILLLIACSNVANLLLTRSLARRNEIAMRLALGASRGRIVAQLFTESLLLGLAGGVGGFLLACAGFRWLLRLAPAMATFRPDTIRMDWGVFLFAMVVSAGAAIGFGFTPAARAAGVTLDQWLRRWGHGARGNAPRSWSRNAVVVAEIALALVLLSGAGLVLESFRHLQNDDLNFNSDRVLTMWTCCLAPANYPGQREISEYYQRVFTRLRELPGVQAASATTRLPIRQVNDISSQFDMQGSRSKETQPVADLLFAEEDFFRTMQIPLVRGRYFDGSDTAEHTPVALINQSMAARFWPGQDPLGQEIRPHSGDGSDRWHRIVGVVADAKQRGRGIDAGPTYYLNFYQERVRYAYFVIRTRGEPLGLAGAVKDVIWSVDHTLPLENTRSIEQVMDASLSTQRFSTWLLSLFAALAVSLATLGVYGVLTHRVVQRTQEIGVRMALGASARAILGMVLREGMAMSVAGLAWGLAGTLALTKFLKGLLYGIGEHDPRVLVGAVVFLTLIALASCAVPALRAMRVDPVTALRGE